MGRKLTDSEKTLIGVSTYSEFENILNDMFISPRQKQIAIMYYFERKTYMEIGHEVGYSEVTVSREMRDFSRKLAKYINSHN